MANLLPSEKLQEERLIRKLRDYQRANQPNKRCFDCNEMMPQYICLDFNTFVCTACSGIHREFAHRVKSISMSKFTESEVKTMINHGGNEAAQKYWRSKHDPSFRPSGGNDGERTRNFIRLTYIDRKWVYESPRRAKDQERERKLKSSKKKEKKCNSDDGLFSSSSKPAKSTTESGFGDFSNFEGSSRTAATVQSFGDFDTFSSSAPAKKATEDYTDFGNFEGSSAAQKITSKTTPPLPAPKFASFKIAPPPGSDFSASSVSAIPATENLMGLSAPKQGDNPFEFDAPAPTTEQSSHPAPVASSSYNFDAPTPSSHAESRPTSALLDPFGNMAAAVPSTPVPAHQNVSPFDAFSTPKVSSPPAFDALSAQSPASTASSNVFDAFGGGEDAFKDFTHSSRTSSANPVLDPFATTAEKPVSAAASADPFAAFDGMQQSNSAASTLGSAAPTPDFGPSTGFPGGNSVSQQQAAMKGPFGFASATINNSGFPTAQQPQYHPAAQQPQYYHATGATSQPFGGFSQQQQLQNAFGHQMQQQSMQSFVQGQPPQNQQQWYGQQQGFPGQQQPTHLTGHQYAVQFPPRPAGGAPPAPITVKTPASASSINDPFASLSIGNLGFGGSSNSTTTHTGSGGGASFAPFAPANQPGTINSFGNAPTSSGSISYAQPQARAAVSLPQQNTTTFADPNAFADFAGAPGPAPAQTSASSANPFDLF
ncbi:unnamed protein product [Peronospora effusa]|nr:unnamed protein product [Peronospora effusa]